jgi:membrane protease YdiL (CAAX protease family)
VVASLHAADEDEQLRKEQEMMDGPTDERDSTGLARLANRFPVTVFLALAFGLSYPLMSLAVMAQYGVIPGKSLPQLVGLDMERAASMLLVLSLTAATFLTTALQGGRPAVKVLLRRILRWRVPLVWWLVAVVALPTTTVVLAAFFGDSVDIPSGGVIAQEVLSITIALILINLWEETAWAGFLQTRLEHRHNFFVAAALTAVGFAAVHVPLRIINGEATTLRTVGTAFLSLLVLGLIFRSLIGMVLRGAANSILLAAVTHTFFNRSNNIDGIAADLLEGGNQPIAALLAATLLAVVLGVCLRRKLRRSYRKALDEAEDRAPARPQPVAA